MNTCCANIYTANWHLGCLSLGLSRPKNTVYTHRRGQICPKKVTDCACEIPKALLVAPCRGSLATQVWFEWPTNRIWSPIQKSTDQNMRLKYKPSILQGTAGEELSKSNTDYHPDEDKLKTTTARERLVLNIQPHTPSVIPYAQTMASKVSPQQLDKWPVRFHSVAPATGACLVSKKRAACIMEFWRVFWMEKHMNHIPS